MPCRLLLLVECFLSFLECCDEALNCGSRGPAGGARFSLFLSLAFIVGMMFMVLWKLWQGGTRDA